MAHSNTCVISVPILLPALILYCNRVIIAAKLQLTGVLQQRSHCAPYSWCEQCVASDWPVLHNSAEFDHCSKASLSSKSLFEADMPPLIQPSTEKEGPSLLGFPKDGMHVNQMNTDLQQWMHN